MRPINPSWGAIAIHEKETTKKTKQENKTIGVIYFEAGKPFLGSYRYTKRTQTGNTQVKTTSTGIVYFEAG